jgi:primosomal protein N' (replication factor Y)
MTQGNSHYTDSLWEEFAEVDIADVVVDIDAPDLHPSYSYRIPETLQNQVTVGACVHIPFAGRETLGYVLEQRKLSTSDPLCRKLKDIIAVIEDAITINAEQLQTVRWMSDRYVCDLLAAIRCVAPATLGASVVTVARLKESELRGSDAGDSMPQAHLIEILRALDGEAELDALREAANLPGFASAYAALLKKGLLVETRQVSRAKTVGKKIKAYTLGAAAEVLSGASGGLGKRSPQQQRLLHALVERARQGEGPLPADELLQTAQASAASLKGLVDKGLVVAQEMTVRRAPILSPEKRTTAPVLTPGQQQAAETLRACIAQGRAQTILLFGVTASGKTEVYLDAIAHTLQAGRSAIVLVPEIALTTQVVDVFVGRFGEQVAVLHSRLSEGERHDEWRRMQEGRARIVVGARSAVFAPVADVGLIVVDEEHEASYKQENTPRYNARELAGVRARLTGATLVLGSATPSLETYFLSEQNRLPISDCPHPTPDSRPPGAPQGSSSLLRIEMRERIDNRPLPSVEVVDLREEFKQRRALFSERLTEAMAARLSRKQQIILFLNRRGYAQFVLCRDCGWVAKCPNCAVSLAFHAYDRALKCHHCEYHGRAPQICPDCGSTKVKAFGIGTEKVEEEVLKIFPSAQVARMDRDTTARKGAHSRILRDFRQGDAEILIGTQMVAKGLDFPNVTLVGVISADTSINMPDFRAAERTFQLLTQVAGRAGRGVSPGEVIIQTFSPDHYAIQASVHQDYAAFYRQEILFRKELRYPPFSRFANLICADAVEAKAQDRATGLAAALARVVPVEVEIIGPSAAPLARLKNQYRYHVALRAPVDAPLADMVRAALALLTPLERLSLSIDMDPLSMA